MFAGVTLALALIGLTGFLLAINWKPDERAFPEQGIDVSERNGAINWWGVKRAYGVRFVYARATMGAKERDARFADYWRGLYEAGIPRGAIHVFSLCQLAADQAGNLVSTVPRSDDQLPVALMLDFEGSCPARPERDVVIGEINRFLEGVEAHTGKPAILKVSSAFEDRYRVSAGIQRKLWSVQAFFPGSYFDKPWTMWQASSFRRIEGVAGMVNWNVMVK
ncbi:GH25 family lysozyme [Sphingomonas sp. AOB5]|uniref:glycoside hydrolase family 25 protein n=1 Tax=Sphingomonas sp. AOB5 TaxID=3034017 RepID=UPI0023F79A7A|nr:GH25 family lysozyme [Sphingomonas sp. AOB5]MDF7776013.1 GH25 family lysozyme [Sphingomonas sp. AOB5]